MKEARTTNLGFAILGLLHQAPLSGYDLRKVFAETALGNYSSSPGAIYPALRRLEKEGLVRGREDRSTSLRPRKLYRPTALGAKSFRRWLEQEIEREDISRGVDALMLRFAFRELSDDEVAGFVDDSEAEPAQWYYRGLSEAFLGALDEISESLGVAFLSALDAQPDA